MRKPRSRRLVHIGDILSITSGRLVSREGFSSVHCALTYMAGEDVYVHQVVRVMDEARPVLLERYPLLADVVPPDDIDETTVGDWLNAQSRLYGEFLELPRISRGQHKNINPVSEALEQKNADAVAVLKAPHSTH
jgi:hypothetical protein